VTESALRHKNYAIYLAGNTLSLHGLWVYRVALGWFAWQLSHSELWVGIVAFTQFAPAVVFGPIFGVLADRFDRKATSILVNSCSVINMLLLGLLTALEFIDIRVLALLSLMQGVLDGAHVPVRLSIVPNLVPRAQLESAIALTSVAFNLSRFVGPALAGPVIAVWGVGTAFVINGVSYLALIAAMVVVRLNPSGSRKERKHPWTELQEGAQYVFSHPVVRALLLAVAAGSIFARGGLEMLPAFVDVVYGKGASALATLTSAIGGGAVVAGLLLTRRTAWMSVNVVRVGIFVSGLLVIAFGYASDFRLAVALVTLLGAILTLCAIGSQILIQSSIEDDMRGRVGSFWAMIVMGGTSLGGLLVGAAAGSFGLEAAVAASGVLCALTILGSHRLND
jgi:MFS family permease